MKLEWDTGRCWEGDLGTRGVLGGGRAGGLVLVESWGGGSAWRERTGWDGHPWDGVQELGENVFGGAALAKRGLGCAGADWREHWGGGRTGATCVPKMWWVYFPRVPDGSRVHSGPRAE